MFSLEEVRNALFAHCQRTSRKLPDGVVTRASVGDDAGTLVTLHSAPWPGDPEQPAASFNRVEVAAALIKFCIECRIPMPRAASKTLVRNGDSLMLVLEV
jgi:hypothetical protein